MSELNDIVGPKRLRLDHLRRFAPKKIAVECCDLCNVPVGSVHRHLLELKTERILCACDPCGVLFGNDSRARYKRIPRDIKRLDDFQLNDVQWESLAIPIGLAFFFRNSSAEKTVAFYPSPAGATESLLDLSAWQDLLNDNSALATMEPDVEALLVNRIKTAREYYIVPIDECYKLVGIIRTNWRGVSGGTEVWKSIDQFFCALRERAVRPMQTGAANATA